MQSVLKTVWIWLLIVLLLGCAAEAPAQETATPLTEPVSEEIVSRTREPDTPIPTPEPTPVPTPEPTPEPTDTPVPKPTPFSIVWMSDTQNLSRHNPDVFNKMRDWILEEKDARNIVFVAHTGDVVDGCSQFMWDNATDALMPVLDAIPAMIVSGNHDISKNMVYSAFSKRPYAKAVQKDGQTFDDGKAAYATFEAGGDTFLVFGIGYEVRGAKLKKWIRDVREQFPDAIALYVVHFGLQPNGRFSGQARELFDSVIHDDPKARLMLCGHHRGTLQREDFFDDDGDGEAERSFHTLMFNYQDDRTDGLGYLRILTFDPEARSIEISTYSPWFDRWGYVKAKEGEDAFVLTDAY